MTLMVKGELVSLLDKRYCWTVMKADKKSAVLHGMWFSQVFAQSTEDKQFGIINTLFYVI